MGAPSDQERLQALLGAPGLSWILQRLRRRMESGQGLHGTLHLDRPSEAEVEAVRRLLGRVPRGDGLNVAVGELEELLRAAGVQAKLPEAILLLLGPSQDGRASIGSEGSAWDAAFACLTDRRPQVREWAAELRQSGLVKRVANGDPVVAGRLLARAERLAERLPSEGVLLTDLATAVSGNPQALDVGEPLAAVTWRLVLRLGEGLGGGLGGELGGRPVDARRAAWRAVGVELDAVQGSVLVLNLVARGQGATPALLTACAAAGEPCRLTWRQVRALTECAPREVFLCENPSIVAAAADRLGSRSAPLICTEGVPSLAARGLLRLLSGTGARVRYHGHFDWPSARIANGILETTGGEPWRMNVADYEVAPKGTALEGAPVTPSWAPKLREAMERDGRSVYEEGAMSGLLGDLGRG